MTHLRTHTYTQAYARRHKTAYADLSSHTDFKDTTSCLSIHAYVHPCAFAQRSARVHTHTDTDTDTHTHTHTHCTYTCKHNLM
jgi:hypothetical protein